MTRMTIHEIPIDFPSTVTAQSYIHITKRTFRTLVIDRRKYRSNDWCGTRAFTSTGDLNTFTAMDATLKLFSVQCNSNRDTVKSSFQHTCTFLTGSTVSIECATTIKRCNRSF